MGLVIPKWKIGDTKSLKKRTFALPLRNDIINNKPSP